MEVAVLVVLACDVIHRHVDSAQVDLIAHLTLPVGTVNEFLELFGEVQLLLVFVFFDAEGHPADLCAECVAWLPVTLAHLVEFRFPLIAIDHEDFKVREGAEEPVIALNIADAAERTGRQSDELVNLGCDVITVGGQRIQKLLVATRKAEVRDLF